jgi:hypothetical protein
MKFLEKINGIPKLYSNVIARSKISVEWTGRGYREGQNKTTRKRMILPHTRDNEKGGKLHGNKRNGNIVGRQKNLNNFQPSTSTNRNKVKKKRC